MTRILIVEDSPTQAAQLQFILEAEHIDVDAAPDAEAGMVMFEAGHYDMVISDIMMPGLSGYDLPSHQAPPDQARYAGHPAVDPVRPDGHHPRAGMRGR